MNSQRFGGYNPHQQIRYTEIVLPAQRYVPGRSTHPRKAEMGTTVPLASRLSKPPVEHQSGLPQQYLYGIDLYNHYYWWEAHEAWEVLWLHSARESCDRHFYQGLIKASAALLKGHLQQMRGIERLSRSSAAHLEIVQASASVWKGLALGSFVERFVAYCDAAIGGAEAPYPFLVLRLK